MPHQHDPLFMMDKTYRSCVTQSDTLASSRLFFIPHFVIETGRCDAFFHTADDFIQQLELQHKLKVVNEQLRRQDSDDDVALDGADRRKVTFSDHLVQYSPDDDDDDDDDFEPLQHQDVDDGSASIDWTQDLIDCLPDSDDDDDDDGPVDRRGNMLYDSFIGESLRKFTARIG